MACILFSSIYILHIFYGQYSSKNAQTYPHPPRQSIISHNTKIPPKYKQQSTYLVYIYTDTEPVHIVLHHTISSIQDTFKITLFVGIITLSSCPGVVMRGWGWRWTSYFDILNIWMDRCPCSEQTLQFKRIQLKLKQDT